METINDIIIEGIYTDSGKGSFTTSYKFVTVKEITSNSIRFQDNKGYYSWMTFEHFQKRMTLKKLL